MWWIGNRSGGSCACQHINLQIRKSHRSELKMRRSDRLTQCLQHMSGWNKWQTNPFTPLHHQTVQQPPTDDNANMFHCLVFYCGNPNNSPRRADLSEPAQTTQLLRQTIHRSKINGIPHDVSIAIHFLNNCSNFFLLCIFVRSALVFAEFSRILC